MSNDTTKTKRPTHTAFSVRKYKVHGEHKAKWTAIGAAWTHSDGEGFDIVLDAYPLNGRVLLRKEKPEPEDARAEVAACGSVARRSRTFIHQSY